jgi:hypothetical protein
MGIEDVVLTDDNADGLAELAWRGLVEKAKLSLPILIDDHENVFLDLDEITDRIACRARDILTSRLNEAPLVENEKLQADGPPVQPFKETPIKEIAAPDFAPGPCEDGLCAFL